MLVQYLMTGLTEEKIPMASVGRTLRTDTHSDLSGSSACVRQTSWRAHCASSAWVAGARICGGKQTAFEKQNVTTGGALESETSALKEPSGRAKVR